MRGVGGSEKGEGGGEVFTPQVWRLNFFVPLGAPRGVNMN